MAKCDKCDRCRCSAGGFLDDMEDGINGVMGLLFWAAGIAVVVTAALLFKGVI